jgi:hypothetical protein
MQVAIINKHSEKVYGIFNASSIDKALDEWANKCGLDNYAELQKVSKDDISRDNLLILSDNATYNARAKLEFIIHIYENPVGDTTFYNVYVRYGKRIDWYPIQYDPDKDKIGDTDCYEDNGCMHRANTAFPLARVPEVVKQELIKLIPDSILETSPT